MNRRELVAELAEELESDKKSTDEFLTAFIDVVTDTVSSGETITITGFAKFARVERAARMGRNPQTGEPIKIPAKTVVKARIAKQLKDAVLPRK